jgi:hypothetical protein
MEHGAEGWRLEERCALGWRQLAEIRGQTSEVGGQKSAAFPDGFRLR